jgi:hypothetical protein
LKIAWQAAPLDLPLERRRWSDLCGAPSSRARVFMDFMAAAFARDPALNAG